MPPEHPNRPKRAQLVVAFVGIVLAGALGGAIGWGIVDQWRKDNSLPTLKDADREPSYIRIAGELGLGMYDKNRIRLREVAL